MHSGVRIPPPQPWKLYLRPLRSRGLFVCYDIGMDKIDQYLKSLPEWQNVNLTKFRSIVHEVIPSVVEDFKWNVPVFLVGTKMLFAMSAFKAHTKYNFIANGALLDDPAKLFNNGFDSKKSRAIDLHEGQTVDEDELKDLIKASTERLAF